MESTKEVLVRRSNNLFLPFSNDARYAIGKDIAFSSDPTLFATIMSDGNIHIHGTKSVENSGHVLLYSLTQQLVLKEGSTYNLSISATSPVQFIIQSDQSGTRTNIIQVGPNYVNGAVKTMTEDATITHVYMGISAQATIAVGDTVDEYVNPMLVEQSARMDYEPYYHEYESTKEVLVRRSNNLFLPFTSNPKLTIGADFAFSNDPTLFYTIEENGNIHVHGTKSVLNSGFILYSTFTAPLILKAGKTYSYSYNNAYGNCSLQSTVSGTRVAALSNSIRKATPTIDTPITYLYVDVYLTNKEENIGKEYDFYINPMVVEGDTAQDYEPYYQEYEATSMQINDFYPTGYVVNSKDIIVKNLVDFSNPVYGKIRNNNDGVTLLANDKWAVSEEFMPCEGDTLYWGGFLDKAYGFHQIVVHFYDENKNYIPNSYITIQSWAQNDAKANESKLSPTNAKYMRAEFTRTLSTDATKPYPKFLYVYKDPTA